MPPSENSYTKAPLRGSSDRLENLGELRGTPPLRNYLCLTMFTCFCPAWPVNIVALVFSVLSQNSYNEEDYEGSKRLGKKALHLGIASLVISLVIIAVYTVYFVTLTTVRAHQGGILRSSLNIPRLSWENLDR
ncbi:Transmembrane protein 233 [Merluccius polli]|uniref:Transmembrane protein 233 n=1 Tax=Merluccius polli TaxID=89951 RepID=A0AA47M0L4_MERPO|nr:Transmembrane protein 233 [Merluccius polli]